MAAEKDASNYKRYQKSLIINELLPYSECLEEEANQLFGEIKLNLSIAVQKRDLWPGGLFWTNRLTSFIKIYGFHFTKEDHINLVQLLFHLVTIPNLESPLLKCWSTLLEKLLKKKKLLSPSDIRFSWRPMYDLVVRISDTKFKRLGMKIYSDRAIASVKGLIDSMRCYFTLESTQEILDEGRPLLCPFDTSMLEIMERFNDFLPTKVCPEEFQYTHQLWFKELINIWIEARNNSALDEVGFSLFSRLAEDTIGHIDWSPYLQQIFTHILNNFELPMGVKEFKTPQTQKSMRFPSGEDIAVLIVSLLGGGSKAQEYLSKLMEALESYYYPSNIGLHTRKLLKFLTSLTNKFVLRLKCERHSSDSWLPKPPPSSCLSEKDIDDFVACLCPTVWLSIFSKIGSMEAALAIKNLASLRPEVILPTLMSKTYIALETLTEPHQVVSTLSCVTVVSRAILSGRRFPEGPTHLFLLLISAIPGIDPNDLRKTLASSLLISSLISLVPLVDCSSAIGHVEMTHDEEVLCAATTEFEQFVDDFLERCFVIVESCSSHQQQVESGQIRQEEPKLDSHEALIGASILGAVSTVLGQLSVELFQVAFDKIFRFASTRVFESEVASKICSELCGAASKVHPVLTLKKFVPYCTQNIENILEDGEQVDSDNVDIDLLWNLQLLSHVVATDGDALVSHSESLLRCLNLCVKQIKNKRAAKHVSKLIYSMLHSLTQTYPRDSRLLSLGFDLDPKDHLYIRDWTSSCHIKDTNISWYIPGEKEYEFADEILQKVLKPELDKLDSFTKGTLSLDRDSLLLSLELVNSILSGAAAYLPHYTGPPVDGCPQSEVPLTRWFYKTSSAVHLPPQEFTRQKLFEFFHELKVHLMKNCEDDTKSLISLTEIFKHLMINFGSDHKELDARWTYFKQTRAALRDKLNDKKDFQVRSMTITRAQLQHELRMMDRIMSPLTPLHLTILEDLVDLSISTYAQVRIAAQSAVALCFDTYLFSGRKSLPMIVECLKNNPDTSHETFKGSLYLLLSPPLISTIVHDWEQMRKVFILLIQADHSEKESILNLISRLHNTIQKSYDTFAITYEVPESCIPAAVALSGKPLPPEELAEGAERLKRMNKQNLESYESLINNIVTVTEGKQDLTQWRFTEVSMKLLAMLIRHDTLYPVKGVQLFVTSLVHDALNIRKVSIYAVTLLLQQLKRPKAKVPIDIEKFAGMSISGKLTPGEREDNKWLCLTESLKETEEEWDSNNGVVHKTRYGFYCYPKILYGFAPMDRQPKLNRSIEELSEHEKVFYETFTDEGFLEKLISFHSLEEVKGKDQYSMKRALMFKNLFRNYGNSLSHLFRPHLEKLSIDSQESSQRCCCEIIAGMVRSSTQWPYEMVMEMRSWLEPLFRKIINNIQQETVEDWTQCVSDISADKDPRRVGWFLELLMEDLFTESRGAFTESSQLSLLHIGLAQQEWRVPYLLKKFSLILSSHIDHPYKNVREKIGTLIASIHVLDLSSSGFQLLYNLPLSNLMNLFTPSIPSPPELIALEQDSPTLRVCKTAMATVINSYHASAVEYYELFSLLVPLASYEGDDEVGILVRIMSIQLCRNELNFDHLPVVLKSMKKAASTSVWKAKLLVLYVLQVLVFWNFFTVANHKKELNDLLLSLLGDSQIEVRELASSTISGFVRCGIISPDNLKTLFTKQAKTRLPKKRAALPIEETDGATAAAINDTTNRGYDGLLVDKHCGVLGLAALVQACPYTIPDWLPDIVDELSSHLHDPAPIPVSNEISLIQLLEVTIS
ncbi:PREDICTED: proteasome activator complex subunit 4 [Amphimedon queenslandica]|uniref:Proteasome activator Blm10 mid region domain-containing protein n=1 Tax=Amphimedon queenslandica TaxID=400682 RepID=A0AAN0JP20_AMPQE|nr:PREDICTED: proteasome activator complex subunit 4 [Amphimedon queenslandica]|eukprot:XP_019858537.1 PREDICTED: proteasome activator complex subunit 4 [Amphimedon queenslandica]